MSVIDRVKAILGINNLSQKTAADLNDESLLQEGLDKLSLELATEGIVVLKNEGNVLPLVKNSETAIFGRVQNDYFCVGYGSGGDVNAPYKISLMEAVKENGDILYNAKLAEIYRVWCEKNAPSQGFWGHWPKSYPEMPLDAGTVAEAAKSAKTAVVVIGRAAGEDRENSLDEGSFYLTAEEKSTLDKVTEAFKNVVVVLDASNITDFSWVIEYGEKISAVVFAPQGGMESGRAVRRVLWGEVNPSGKLTDTIATAYFDYPSSRDFGGKKFNNYTEDIYVGYRYFETFSTDKVLFPFGFGLSYTDFSIKCESAVKTDDEITLNFRVTNVGKCSGKEVVQVYFSAPQGVLGKPSLQLCAFEKTPVLTPDEEYSFEIKLDVRNFASYDVCGDSGFKSAYVLEKGGYGLFAGNSVRNVQKVFSFSVDKTIAVKRLSPICALNVDHAFKVLTPVCENGVLKPKYKTVGRTERDLKQRIIENLPEEIPQTGDKGYKLSDVKSGKVTLRDFTAQLSAVELDAICRGDVTMHSPLGARGNAGAFGGVSESLRAKGIPPAITTDGPSGIRVSAKASLLPCGVAMASSWNVALVEKTASLVAKEMKIKGSDVILAPGMNIHRNHLCGRNFEYYSEDPYLTGKIAAAYVRGAQSEGGSACPKHFACNNQETKRNTNDSRLSERALREIYLKGFEICVKEAHPKNIMTSYNKVNGVHSHYNYDLCTEVLRKEWGYEGNVITDWWMRPSVNPDFKHNRDSGYRVRAQVDVLMPGSKMSNFVKADDTAFKSYKKGGLTLGELQRSAMNVLRFILNSAVAKE